MWTTGILFSSSTTNSRRAFASVTTTIPSMNLVGNSTSGFIGRRTPMLRRENANERCAVSVPA